jgi:hypothetical protein
MKWILQLVVLALAFALGTWFVAWWMVPLIGAAYGAWGVRQRVTLITALFAGMAAWGALLGLAAMSGPMGRLLDVLGGVFRLPGGALVMLTLAYGGLLAVSAAAVARGIRRMVTPATPATPA